MGALGLEWDMCVSRSLRRSPGGRMRGCVCRWATVAPVRGAPASAAPARLFACPCRKGLPMSRASKTLVEFAGQMARVAPAVEPFGAYVSARTRVECRCRACGHVRSPYPKGMPQGGTCPGAPNVPRPSAMRGPTSGRNAETSPSEPPSRGISASQPLAVLVSLTLAIEASEAITRCSSLQYNVEPLLLAGGVAVVAPLRLCLRYFRFVSRIVVSSGCMWSSGHGVRSGAPPAPLT